MFQVSILPPKNAPRSGGRVRSQHTWIVLIIVQVVFLWFALPASSTDAIEPIDVSMQARARGGADVAVGDSVREGQVLVELE